MESVKWQGGTPAGRRLADILFRDSEAEDGGAGAADGHVLFYRGEGGYEIRSAEGGCPQPGDSVDGLLVVKVGMSPLPGDPRPCAFLEPEPS